jgi:phosphoribosyl-ATP pyrophosphohydrolase/phosphoribosyl-AMP cyclohydrolase
MLDLGTLNYDQRGLIPVVAQDSATGEVLMLGYASRETLSESLDLGKLVFFSRSRNSRWLKGETSGNFLEVVSMMTDCDRDSVIAKVRPHGPACHLGTPSCFGAES